MNIQKAREYFSAYFENTLDAGLRQSFERALREDAQMQAEYRAFERVMGQLNALRDVPVEVPFNLHDRICQKIDLHVYEQKRQSPRVFGGIWKSLAYGGVAAVAIVGAFMAMNSRGGNSTAAGSIVSGGAVAPRLTLVEGVPTLSAMSQDGVLKVVDIDTEKTLSEVPLRGQRLQSPLRYNSEQPVLISITQSDVAGRLIVALPGTKRSSETNGSGKLRDLAKRMAELYRCPVEVIAADLDREVEWKLHTSDPVKSVLTSAGSGPAIGMEQRASGVIAIHQN